MARSGRTTAFIALARALRGSAQGGEPGLGRRLGAIPRLVRATLRGEYRGTTRRDLALIALAVLYTLSPVDFVPELFIPFLGLADDALVVTWIAGRLLAETEAFLGWESSGERTAGGAPAHQDVVPGRVVHH